MRKTGYLPDWRRGLVGTLMLLIVWGGAAALASAPEESAEVLVTVNGQPITEGDLEFEMLSRRVPDNLRTQLRQRFLDQLIDKRLLQAYLLRHKTQPNREQLEAQVNAILEMIRKKGDDPDRVLARLGYTVESLRNELALPLAWKAYVHSVVTASQLRQYWAQHRREFDGTQVHAAHILRKAKTESERAEAESKLRRIRSDIVDGVISFAEAARQYSESPSRNQGGDLGTFAYHGKMAVEFSKAAFPLQVGQVSQPFHTSFGVHLLTVTERIAGQLSLEDVRDGIFDQMGEALRREIVKRERAKARIEFFGPHP